MQVFYLDKNPIRAARMLCDKHTVSQPKEAVQILSGVLHMTYQPIDGIYKAIMVNNPCCIWARQSILHYRWIWCHALEGFDQYTQRYKRRHKSEGVLGLLPLLPNLPYIDWQDPPQFMPKQYRQESTVEAYRAYYRGEKAYFAKWGKLNNTPDWW